VNNLENKFTLNSLQLGSTTGNYWGYPDPPRTFGLRIGKKFQ
jgi:outer membrane receptor protein involved in Fe transport